MFDLWVQEIKTGKCWRVDNDSSKPVYTDENGQTKFELDDVSKYKFFPCCPKEAPKFETESDFEQMNIFDFLEGD